MIATASCSDGLPASTGAAEPTPAERLRPYDARDPAGRHRAVGTRVGALDFGSTRVLRELLFDRTESGTQFLVDWSQMDDQHEMTLFALLAAKARAAT